MTIRAKNAIRTATTTARHHPLLFLACFYLFMLLLCACVPWLLAPKDFAEQDIPNRLAAPFSGHGLLGTDEVGRDMVSRLVYGGRTATLAATEAVLIALAIGVPVGLVGGYLQRGVGEALMRVNDIFMSFPPLLFALTVLAVVGTGLTNAMFAVGLMFAPTYVRLVRGVVMDVRGHTYFEASMTLGSSPGSMVRAHVLRAAAGPILIQVALSAAFAMLSEAALSFLGLGVVPPTSSWGLMMTQGVQLIDTQPWLMVWPGLALTATVLSLNVVSDALRAKMGGNRS